MNQTRPFPITNGSLILDATILAEAHIADKARVIVQEGRITILPDKDAVEDSFGSIKVPKATARYIAESKDLEYDV
jgi:hypothetical protein